MEQPRTPRKEMMPLKRPQMKIVLLVGCVLFLTCIVVSVLQTYFFLTGLHQRAAPQGEMAGEVWLITSLVALVTLLVMAPVSMFIAVWVSYRILGPVRRVAREMESVGEGRVGGGFAFRAGDDLTFLATFVRRDERGPGAPRGRVPGGRVRDGPSRAARRVRRLHGRRRRTGSRRRTTEAGGRRIAGQARSVQGLAGRSGFE